MGGKRHEENWAESQAPVEANRRPRGRREGEEREQAGKTLWETEDGSCLNLLKTFQKLSEAYQISESSPTLPLSHCGK